ncbi:hypothetical protein ILYODFUR_017556 [Ilyodon furcidens]|uniref:Uncharacterized protein n=1 Tax=Ilyodon furcidens TaxID=33524 RepID=A0ABV0UU52_9TELE
MHLVGFPMANRLWMTSQTKSGSESCMMTTRTRNETYPGMVEVLQKGAWLACGIPEAADGYHEAKHRRLQMQNHAWDHLGILPEELKEVSGEREVWVSPLSLIPLRPGPDEWKMTSMSTFFLKGNK